MSDRIQGQTLLWRHFRAQAKPFKRPFTTAVYFDLACLLFLFFIVGSKFVIKPAVRISLPPAPLVTGVSVDSHVLTVAGEQLMFFDDERTSIDRLAVTFTELARKDPNAELIIEADRRVPQGVLVDIYRTAMNAGIRDVALATGLQPEDAQTP